MVVLSLALLSDAARMFTDAAALAVALMAIKIGERTRANLRNLRRARWLPRDFRFSGSDRSERERACRYWIG